MPLRIGSITMSLPYSNAVTGRISVAFALFTVILTILLTDSWSLSGMVVIFKL